MYRSLRYPLVAVAACAAIAAPGVASAASTASTPTASPSTVSASAIAKASGKSLAAIQAAATAAIGARLTALNSAISSVNANVTITGADRAALLSTLNHDVSGLTDLRSTIAADTTAAQAATDAATLYTGYRVYALALPQARYAEAADDLTGAVLPKLTDAQTTLKALLAGVDASKNTPAVQAAMADLATKIAGATSATTGMSATVLAYVPAQWNANHALLHDPRQQLRTAGQDVAAAGTDIATVVGALQ